MTVRHKGSIRLQHTLDEVHRWLSLDRPAALMTADGDPFQAMAYTAGEGPHDGEKVIRIMKDAHSFIVVYSCCWGHEGSCERERIGSYLKALDTAVPIELS